MSAFSVSDSASASRSGCAAGSLLIVSLSSGQTRTACVALFGDREEERLVRVADFAGESVLGTAQGPLTDVLKYARKVSR